MNNILKKIREIMDAKQDKMGFLDALFGIHKQETLKDKPVVLFGAGDLGKELYSTLKHHGVFPVCFCDNDSSKSGSLHCGVPIISFDQMKNTHKDSLIVIAAKKYVEPITKQLLENGFNTDQILCKKSDTYRNLVFMYSMIGTQVILVEFKQNYSPKTIFDVLLQNEQKVSDAYNLFSDKKSKELFISKLALMASDGNFELFKDFILNFSEPIHEFGVFNYEGTTEDYYYFNNDILTLSQNEVYVDVGAFDGDTLKTFVEACNKHNVDYKHIYAFEPDPLLYQTLVKNTIGYKNISYHQLGLGSQTKILRFMSSDKDSRYHVGLQNDTGNIEIQVVSLDEFLSGQSVTFVKMDPGGNIIPDLIKGAANTIAKCKPKLALGVYHSVEAIYEIPLLVKSICPDYKLYLRHNTYHLCDTALYATV